MITAGPHLRYSTPDIHEDQVSHSAHDYAMALARGLKPHLVRTFKLSNDHRFDES